MIVLGVGTAAGVALIAFAPATPSEFSNVVGLLGLATLASLPFVCGVMSFRLLMPRRWGMIFAATLIALICSVAGLAAGLVLRVEFGLPI
jgi:hypothetical protein